MPTPHIKVNRAVLVKLNDIGFPKSAEDRVTLQGLNLEDLTALVSSVPTQGHKPLVIARTQRLRLVIPMQSL
jgi:hypothetical protein